MQIVFEGKGKWNAYRVFSQLLLCSRYLHNTCSVLEEQLAGKSYFFPYVKLAPLLLIYMMAVLIAS